MLGKSGVNTDIFGAHSTRHASTSAASRNGADIESIRKAARWTVKSNVFAEFYDLPLSEPQDFASYIL